MNRSARGGAAVPAAPVRILVLVLVAALAAACGPNGASPTLGPRPSSLATVAILEPEAGETVRGTTLHLSIDLQGAIIVPESTTTLRPDEGHVHLYVDNSLVSMNYGLEQDIPVTAGTHVLKVEFVAADHAPFNPRVWSSEIVVTVQA
jgi:hypothetical protein